MSLALFHIPCVPYFFFRKWEDKPEFCNFGGGIQKRRVAVFKGGWDQTTMKLWFRGKEVLINDKCLIQHIKKILRKPGKLSLLFVDTKKLCVSKYSIERSQKQHKKSSRSRKKWSY